MFINWFSVSSPKEPVPSIIAVTVAIALVSPCKHSWVPCGITRLQSGEGWGYQLSVDRPTKLAETAVVISAYGPFTRTPDNVIRATKKFMSTLIFTRIIY